MQPKTKLILAIAAFLAFFGVTELLYFKLIVYWFVQLIVQRPTFSTFWAFIYMASVLGLIWASIPYAVKIPRKFYWDLLRMYKHYKLEKPYAARHYHRL